MGRKGGGEICLDQGLRSGPGVGHVQAEAWVAEAAGTLGWEERPGGMGVQWALAVSLPGSIIFTVV